MGSWQRLEEVVKLVKFLILCLIFGLASLHFGQKFVFPIYKIVDESNYDLFDD